MSRLRTASRRSVSPIPSSSIQKGRAPMDETGTSEIRIVPLPACARFSLRLRPDAAARIGSAAGYRLDLPINRLAGSDERWSVRLGPDEWLLLSAADDGFAIEAALA